MRKTIKKRQKTKETISPKELERRWKSVDMPLFWQEVAQAVAKEADAYYRARAKSKEGAASHVLV